MIWLVIGALRLDTYTAESDIGRGREREWQV